MSPCGGSRNVVAGLRQGAGDDRRERAGLRGWRGLVEGCEEPRRFFRWRADAKVGSIQKDARRVEAVADVVGRPPGNRQQTAAIVVTEVGKTSAIVGQKPRGGCQTPDSQ